MNQQEVEDLVRESLQQLGGVVVKFKSRPPIGAKCNILWREYEMPQPFVVTRHATAEEWERQKALAEGQGGPHNHVADRKRGGIPMFLVTD